VEVRFIGRRNRSTRKKITDQSYFNVNVIIFIDSIHIIKPKQRIKCHMCPIIYLSLNTIAITLAPNHVTLYGNLLVFIIRSS
jgi:GTPase Era involved in 16S rRNA processing